jgi:co-chaperonin GroES (HSP10)
MIKSKFLNIYSKYNEAKPNGRLNGDRLLIEVLRAEELEKSKGGIILRAPDDSRSEFNMLKATIAVVLEVGSGFFNPDTNEDIPLSSKVGEVVWMADANIRFLTTVPDHSSAMPEKIIALANESSIIKSWPSLEAFMQDKALFESLAGENV